MFSSSTKYAIRTILYLSERGEDAKSTVDEIAAALDIPKPYLGKILQQLSRSGIISSLKGRGGGFYLSSVNKKKNLTDVVVCIDGKNVLNQCLLGLPHCSEKNPCILHTEYYTFKESLRKPLLEKNIGQMLNEHASAKLK